MAKGKKTQPKKAKNDDMSKREFDDFLSELSQVTEGNTALHHAAPQSKKQRRANKKNATTAAAAPPAEEIDQGMLNRLYEALKQFSPEAPQDGTAPLPEIADIKMEPAAEENWVKVDKEKETTTTTTTTTPPSATDTALDEIRKVGGDKSWAVLKAETPLQMIASGAGGVGTLLEHIPKDEVVYAFVRHETVVGSLTVAKRVCLVFIGDDEAMSPVQRFKSLARQEEMTKALSSQMTLRVEPHWDQAQLLSEVKRVCEGAAVEDVAA